MLKYIYKQKIKQNKIRIKNNKISTRITELSLKQTNKKWANIHIKYKAKYKTKRYYSYKPIIDLN